MLRRSPSQFGFERKGVRVFFAKWGLSYIKDQHGGGTPMGDAQGDAPGSSPRAMPSEPPDGNRPGRSLLHRGNRRFGVQHRKIRVYLLPGSLATDVRRLQVGQGRLPSNGPTTFAGFSPICPLVHGA